MGLPPSAATQALDSIEVILDGFEAASVGVGERLACVQRTRGLASRLSALSAVLLAQADASQESLRAAGTPTTSWLALQGGLSKREAAGLLHQARDLAAHPAVAEAATAGRLSLGKARVIGTVLGGLDGLDGTQQAKAEQVLLDLARGLDVDTLGRTAPQVLAAVAPERADESLERRLQRQAETAHRDRSLRFFRQDGSVRFDGSLPLAEGEAWISLINAYTESRRRSAVEERDPLATSLTPEQRRADALIAMIHAHQADRRAPAVGGDRPRVVVTMEYEKLRAEAAAAGLIGDGEPISAGDLRRLCCDADLLPAVLDGPSTVLDVGRERRLVTPEIRAALNLRDGGCIFPGCSTTTSTCDAHHVVPWSRGGETSLRNLCLVCHHHHTLVEPARYGTRDQWEVRLAADGVPEVIPPRRCDPQRRPLRHARFRARARPPSEGDGSSRTAGTAA